MKLTEILLDEVFSNFNEIFKNIEESYQIDETITNVKLKNLLNKADTEIFPLFGITKENTDKYVIVGSSFLYLFPKLVDEFNLKEIGDLDILIPGEKQWEYFKNNFDKNKWKEHEANWKQGIYRPNPNDPNPEIEVFDAWKPQKAKGEDLTKFNVSSADEIMKNSKVRDGYNFMGLKDILDYKVGLSRPEKEGELIDAFYKSKGKDDFIKKVMSIIGQTEP